MPGQWYPMYQLLLNSRVPDNCVRSSLHADRMDERGSEIRIPERTLRGMYFVLEQICCSTPGHVPINKGDPIANARVFRVAWHKESVQPVDEIRARRLLTTNTRTSFLLYL